MPGYQAMDASRPETTSWASSTKTRTGWRCATSPLLMSTI